MRKFIFILLCVIGVVNVLANGEHAIVFSGSRPAGNATVSSLESIILEFDLTDIKNTFNSADINQWGIRSTMTAEVTGWAFKSARLYKGDITPTDEGQLFYTGDLISSCTKKVDATSDKFIAGNTLELNFPNVIVESGQKYTLYIPANCISADNITLNTADRKTVNSQALCTREIILVFYGAAAENELTLKSYSPIAIEKPLKTLDQLSLSFSYNNYDLAIKTGGAQASLYEGEELIKSVDIVLDPNDNNTVIADFGNEILYIKHTYCIVIPENSLFPLDPDTQQPITDKGNKLIKLEGYNGASYKYLELGRVNPGNNSVVSYLSTISIPFKFPDGYGLGQSEPSVNLYNGSKDGELIGTYQCEMSADVKTLVAPIWDFDLKPNSTYTLVLQEGVIIPTTADLKNKMSDTTNPEVILTYTTPAVLELPDKISFFNSVPADNSELEKLETISLTFNSYSFNNTDYYPVIADENMSATLYEISHGSEKELQPVKLTISNNTGANQYVATGTIDRILYEGKNYKLRIPAGYFRPNNEHLSIVAANNETVYIFIGKSSPYSIVTDNSSIIAGSSMQSLTLASFYFTDEVLPTTDAVMELYTEDAEIPIKTAPIRGEREDNYTRIYADFCDASTGYTPFSLGNTNYRLSLPQGCLTSESDENLKNGIVNVEFKGITPTEFVRVSYELGDKVSTTTQVVKGNTVTYTIIPQTGWEIESLFFNEQQAKEDIIANVYTTPILTTDATVKVIFSYTGFTYTENPTGVIEVTGSDLKSYSEGGNIIVTGLAIGDIVTVYSIGGSVLGHYKATEVESVITVPSDATYLIQVNDVVMKLFNK